MDFTFLSVDRKRGRIGIEAAGILPHFHGFIVMKKVKDNVLAAGKDEVSYSNLHKFDIHYVEIIKTAYEENPLQEPTAKKRDRQKEQNVRSNLQTGKL